MEKITCKFCSAETETEDVCTECQNIVDQYSVEAVEAYLACTSASNLDYFEEAYQGKYASDEDFARDLAESTGAIPKDNPWPCYCIDWEYAARELMYDYSGDDGYYFRNL